MPKWLTVVVTAVFAVLLGFALGAIAVKPDTSKLDTQIEEANQKTQSAQAKIRTLQSQIISVKAEIRKANKLNSDLFQKNAKANKLNSELSLKIAKARIPAPEGNTDAKKETEKQTANKKPNRFALATPMFGIYLGEKIEDLNRRNDVFQSQLTFEDEDHPGKIWSVAHTNPSVHSILVYTYNNLIYDIEVSFTDGSQANYAAIKSELEEKYKSNDKGGLTGSLFSEGVFRPVVDGFEIKIKLNHDIGFMEDDKLELNYTHAPLRAKVYEVLKRRKASKVNNDL